MLAYWSCPVCDLDSGVTTSTVQAAYLATTHDTVHHRGAPTARVESLLPARVLTVGGPR